MDSQTFAVIDLLINGMLMSFYFVLSFMYYQGLRYSRSEGKPILRGMTLVWFVFGVHCLTSHVISAVGYLATGEGGPYYLDTERMTVEIMMLLAVLYFLYAVIRRNPVSSEDTP